MDDFQAEVARIALAVAGPHGFALAGGGALVAHGIVSRATEDIDLFTNIDHGVGVLHLRSRRL
jgi:Nucleotidyl transferase AbiEii toxin, Type IV TA system